MTEEMVRIIIDGIFDILGTVALVFIVPWIKLKIQNTWIEKAVKAAEQIYVESGTGEQKKEFVINFLLEKGIIKKDKDGKIPVDIDILIEAAVRELDNIIVAE